MVAGLKGILPVLPTPFLADGGIDQAGMERLVIFALEKGVDGAQRETMRRLWAMMGSTISI